MQIINSISWGGSILAVLFLGKFEAKSIFVVGHATIGVSLLGTAYFIGSGEQILTLSGFCFSVFAQQLCNAAIIAYQCDKLMDSAFGVANMSRIVIY